MINKAIAVGIIALSLPLGMTQAQAGDEGWAAFGGFVGGTLISSFTSSRHRHHSSGHYSPPAHHQPSGRYEYETRKVWVAGHYDYERDDCGRRVKIWHPGHYKYEKVKVWVSRGGHGRSCRY